MTDYANEPNVTAFGYPESVSLIPTNAPKSKMSGIRPDLQYGYENHPNIEAFTYEEKPEKEKSSSSVHQMIMKHLEERQKAQDDPSYTQMVRRHL